MKYFELELTKKFEIPLLFLLTLGRKIKFIDTSYTSGIEVGNTNYLYFTRRC